MLIGRYEHTLDGKGRISVPAKIRESLAADYGEERLYLTSLENHVVVYPFKEWEIITQKIRQAPNMDRSVRDFIRIFYSNAFEVTFDQQGRILIPPQMRVKVGIDKEVVLVGVMNKIEIWGKERWDSFEASFQLDHEKLAGFGI